MWRNIASTALSFLVVVLVVLGGLVAWGQRQYEAAGPLDTAMCLRVQQGSNFSRVSQSLTDQGAISSATIFRLGASYSDKTAALKAGSFLVPEHASMHDIVDIVTRGGADTCGNEIVFRIGVTANTMLVREFNAATEAFSTKAEFAPDAAQIPADYLKFRDQPGTRFNIQLVEGATSWQVVEGLKQAEFLTGELTDVPPEGVLAPDRYEVHPGDARSDVLAEMRRAQEIRLAEAWANRAEGLPYATPQEALIMASIVEKETGIASERRTVASVFLNRLARGMKLQTDPTVIYGITNGQGALGRGLRQSELRADTPYNTYVIEGLPPTPIANPGRASIEAALDPASTDYLFFVAKTLDPRDGHAFSATLAEHNANVAKLRAMEAEQGAQ